jgi:hypothetical protein
VRQAPACTVQPIQRSSWPWMQFRDGKGCPLSDQLLQLVIGVANLVVLLTPMTTVSCRVLKGPITGHAAQAVVALAT